MRKKQKESSAKYFEVFKTEKNISFWTPFKIQFMKDEAFPLSAVFFCPSSVTSLYPRRRRQQRRQTLNFSKDDIKQKKKDFLAANQKMRWSFNVWFKKMVALKSKRMGASMAKAYFRDAAWRGWEIQFKMETSLYISHDQNAKGQCLMRLNLRHIPAEGGG